jgi:hypothetical protein
MNGFAPGLQRLTPGATHSSVSDAERPHNAVLYQTDELVLASVVPTQMQAALFTLTKGPGMPWKPGVLERGRSRLSAAESLSKGDDLETNPCRVDESELIFALELEPILFIRNAVKTPGT